VVRDCLRRNVEHVGRLAVGEAVVADEDEYMTSALRKSVYSSADGSADLVVLHELSGSPARAGCGGLPVGAVSGAGSTAFVQSEVAGYAIEECTEGTLERPGFVSLPEPHEGFLGYILCDILSYDYRRGISHDRCPVPLQNDAHGSGVTPTDVLEQLDVRV
jgi:hypothetical protein